MKFKKGSKLKILSKKKVALGPQCSMEALRSNGPNYIAGHVKSKGVDNHAMVKQVSPKVITPCHTHLDFSGAWAPGDVVEVFDNNSWKLATVSEVLGKMHILVRLLGSSREFKVRKTDIRVRQSWKDDDMAWVMVGKVNIYLLLFHCISFCSIMGYDLENLSCVVRNLWSCCHC